MRKLVFCIALILCLVLIVPVAWSCSETEEENTFVKLLTLLPETARKGRVIILIDYESFRKANGIFLYDEDNQRLTNEEFRDTIMNLSMDGNLFGEHILLYGSYWTGLKDDILSSPIQDSNIGYSITDVNAEINNIYSVSLSSSGIGSLGSNLDALVAAVGNFDTLSTEQALNNRDKWPLWAIDNFKSEECEKITIYSWGDSLEFHLANRRNPPHLDEIGRAVPLAVSNGQLFIGSSTEDIKSAIDSSMDKAPSLADLPEYLLIAQGMHYLNTIEIIIVDELLIRDILASAESYYGTKLENFTTIGMGHGKDDNGEYMALVIVFENQEYAEESVPLLEQRIEAYNKLYKMNFRYEEHLIYDTEISIDDKVLQAKLYTDDELLWRRWFFNELPIMYQE